MKELTDVLLPALLVAVFVGGVFYFSNDPSRLRLLQKLFGRRWTGDNPFPSFQRWTWVLPPPKWQSTAASYLFWAAAFGILTVWMYLRHCSVDSKDWPLLLMPGFMALLLAVQSGRIVARIRSLKSRNDHPQEG